MRFMISFGDRVNLPPSIRRSGYQPWERLEERGGFVAFPYPLPYPEKASRLAKAALLV
jgi:hypothetical protein